jgi:hypothetical protein
MHVERHARARKACREDATSDSETLPRPTCFHDASGLAQNFVFSLATTC